MIANHHRELSFATEFITLMAILPVLISAAHGIFSQCISAVPFAFNIYYLLLKLNRFSLYEDILESFSGISQF